MKYYYLFLLFFLLLSSSVWGQEDSNRTKTEFTYVDQMPVPSVNLVQYLSEHLTYPDDANAANVQGKVILKFIVDEQGKIDNITIFKSVFPSIDSEAIRVVMGMPDWKPGMWKDKPVKVNYTLPIIFKLTK